jgi:hypothetical protein
MYTKSRSRNPSIEIKVYFFRYDDMAEFVLSARFVLNFPPVHTSIPHPFFHSLTYWPPDKGSTFFFTSFVNETGIGNTIIKSRLAVQYTKVDVVIRLSTFVIKQYR